MKRTLSQKFAKQPTSGPFGEVKMDDASRGGTRKIKAVVRVQLHGVQNVPQHEHSVDESALLMWKRGSKKQNQGSTSVEPIVFGMATFKQVVEFSDVTFLQDRTTKDVEEKNLSVTLKVGPASAGNKASKFAAMGTKVVDLAEFYRDGLKVDKIFPLTLGSNPVTLKMTIECRWTHIDNKLIVRGKSGRIIKENGEEEESFDLKTVTFDSEDDVSIAGGDFSEDQEADDMGTGKNEDYGVELQALRRQIEESNAVVEQLQSELKRANESLITYRTTIKTKNEQINDLRSSHDDKAVLIANAEAKAAAATDSSAALRAKMEALSVMLKEREEKNESDRVNFERELRELQARNESLHSQLAAETSSNAQFLATVEKQAAETARVLQEERAARLEAEQELARVSRREEALVTELEEVIPAAAAATDASPRVIDPAAAGSDGSADGGPKGTPVKDVGGAVIDVIRNRRKADQARGTKKRTSSSSSLPAATASSEAAVEEWKEKWRAATAEANVLRAQVESHKAEISNLNDRLSAQTSQQGSNVARLANERDAARRQLKETETRLRAVEKDLQASANQMEGLKKQNLSLAESVRENLEARSVANATMLQLREELNQVSSSVTSKQRELKVASSLHSSQLEELRAQAASQLQEMERKHVEETEALREKVKDLEKQLVDQGKKADAAGSASSGGAPVLKPGTVVDAAVSLGKDAAGGEAAALRQAFRREKMEFERIAERARDDLRRAEDQVLRLERRLAEAEKSTTEARRAADGARRAATEAEAQFAALKEESEDREQVLRHAEKEFLELAQREDGLKARLREQQQSVEQLELRLAAAERTSAAVTQQLESVEKQAALSEQALEEQQARHKEELSSIRDRLTEARAEARQALDRAQAAEGEREALKHKIALLEADVAIQQEAHKAVLRELAAAEAKMRSAERDLERERKRVVEVESSTESLAIEAEAKRMSLQELSQRVIATTDQLRAVEKVSKEERARNEELHAKISQMESLEAERQRQVAVLKEELRAVAEHDKATDELLVRKNANIAKLEAEVEATEAENGQLQAEVSLLKKLAKEREAEAISQKEAAEAATALVEQLRLKMADASKQGADLQHGAERRAAELEQLHKEAQKSAKEAERALRLVEAERATLRERVEQLEASVRTHQAVAETASVVAGRVPLLEKELEGAKESLRTTEQRLHRLGEESGANAQASEQVEELEKEKRERKLVISAVLLGSAEDGGKTSKQSAKLIRDSLLEWDAFGGDGDAVCLAKLANAYTLLLQSSKRSYEHSIRVLGQLCDLAHELKQDLRINDPSVNGIVSVSKGSGGEGSVAAFVEKIEAATERALTLAQKAVFSRLNPYLAPAILNHLPAIDANRIEETVVDSGNERGKFMTHTILSTLTHVRDLAEIFALPVPVTQQLFSTIACNVNAYLFTYLIQTPAVCVPSNAFTIKTRLGLLDDWFGQERNAMFASAYRYFAPLNEASMLLFVDRDTFQNWETMVALCPSLNALQLLSLVEMLSQDETQPKPLPQKVRDEIDRTVLKADDMTLFFKPVSVAPLPNISK